MAFDLEKTLEKTAALVSQVREKGAMLVLFTEAYILAFPRGLSFGTVWASQMGFALAISFHHRGIE